MPDYKTIDDFDAAWEEKNKKNDDIVEEQEAEEVIEENDEEELEFVEEEDISLDDEEEVERQELGDEELEPEKPTKKDKADFAFGQLRKENKEIKEKVSKLEKRNQELEELATSLGYKSAEEMLEAERNRRITKEAESKGIDPAFYQEFKKTQEELEKIRLERESEIRNSKLQRFTNELNDVSQNYSFTEDEKAEIIQAMSDDGYTIDDLIAIKSPKKIILGYAKDKIVEREVQKKLKTDKKSFKEEPFNKNKEKTLKETMDEQIKKEMEEYARERGFNY